MAIIYGWNVIRLEVDEENAELEGVVSRVSWKLSAFDDENKILADEQGILTLPPPNTNSFIEYDSLTEEQVASWVQTLLDIEEIKSRLHGRILKTINNPKNKKRKLPWA